MKTILKQYGYVYRITNLLNHKTYIGQHKSPTTIDSYYGSGALLKKAIHKYGKDNFSKEILAVCETKEELDSKEIELIKKEWNAGRGEYNLSSGGGSNSNLWSKELKEERSRIIKKLWTDENYREKQLTARRKHFLNGGRKLKSEKMIEKWNEEEYSSQMRKKLDSPAVKRKISLKESITRLNDRLKYSSIYQLRWHLKHLEQQDYRNTCGFCIEEKLTEPISLLEIKDILSNNSHSDAKTTNRVKALQRKFNYSAEEIFKHILETPQHIEKEK